VAQVIQKPYECLTCKQQIRISKIDNVPQGQKKKWYKYEMDGVTPHICRKPDQQQEQPLVQHQASNSNYHNLSKEIAATKAHLLLLVGRLDRIEQEIKSHEKRIVN
jgi:hypothetical protein